MIVGGRGDNEDAVEQWRGIVSHISVYNAGLTTQQIQTHFNAAKRYSEAGKIA